MFELSVEGPAARLVLNRPAARNAIPVEGWAELAAKVEEAERSGARILILAGVPGGAFCAGADISDFHVFERDEEARTTFRRAMRIGLEAVAALGIPTAAVIEGACYGAGVALAMACDVRFAGPGALFAITPAKFAIAYPQEDVHRLVALVGPGQAARLLLGAQAIDAAEAARIGLVEIFRETGLAAEIEAHVAAMAANDPESLRVLKRSVALAAQGVSRDDRQDRLFDDMLGSAAAAERLAGYRDRRK